MRVLFAHRRSRHHAVLSQLGQRAGRVNSHLAEQRLLGGARRSSSRPGTGGRRRARLLARRRGDRAPGRCLACQGPRAPVRHTRRYLEKTRHPQRFRRWTGGGCQSHDRDKTVPAYEPCAGHQERSHVVSKQHLASVCSSVGAMALGASSQAYYNTNTERHTTLNIRVALTCQDAAWPQASAAARGPPSRP